MSKMTAFSVPNWLGINHRPIVVIRDRGFDLRDLLFFILAIRLRHLFITISSSKICYQLYVVVGWSINRSRHVLIDKCYFRVGLVSFAWLFNIYPFFISSFLIFISIVHSPVVIGHSLRYYGFGLIILSSYFCVVLIRKLCFSHQSWIGFIR